jgi:hypothetical protein
VLSGADEPPAWSVADEVTLDPPSGGAAQPGAEVLARYGTLRDTVHRR